MVSFTIGSYYCSQQYGISCSILCAGLVKKKKVTEENNFSSLYGVNVLKNALTYHEISWIKVQTLKECVCTTEYNISTPLAYFFYAFASSC